MSGGLLALFDDIAALAKVAAASIDDVAGQAAKAGTKAGRCGHRRYGRHPALCHRLQPGAELPIIGRIALGSLKNKLLILLPAALALSLLLPEAITPLLMIAGPTSATKARRRSTSSSSRTRRTPRKQSSKRRRSMAR